MEISVICSSRRPHMWEDFYDQIHSNNVEYEIIFLGPFKPNFKLPKNCSFIHTIVKPSQCTEIGCRISKGKFIFGPLGDDLISDQNKIIDILYNFIKEQKDDLFLLSIVIILPLILEFL